MPGLTQCVAYGCRMAGLPDDGVVYRFAGVLVPDDGGFTLVRDADAGNFTDSHTAIADQLSERRQHGRADLARSMLDPARLWKNLFELALCATRDVPAVVEQHGAGTGRSLINGQNVSLHHYRYLLIACPCRPTPSSVTRAGATNHAQDTATMGANRCRGVRGLGEIVSLLLYFMFGSEHSVSRCVLGIGARHTFEPAARHLLTSHRTETMTTRQPYDLIVIGGGINGAGIARDAAGRGLDRKRG